MRMTLNYKHKVPTNLHRLSWVSCIALLLMLFGTFQTQAQLVLSECISYIA
jgi:hypothetical protein